VTRASGRPASQTVAVALIRAARAARRRAHAPYSGFRVGAAALTSDGTIVTGCNVENASYGLSICAERAAIHRAVAEGHRRVVVVAVSAGRQGAMPCGACRQVMLEFGVRDVIIDRSGGKPERFALAELLAHPFRGDILPIGPAQSRLP
jgi:cytidine deaminase